MFLVTNYTQTSNEEIKKQTSKEYESVRLISFRKDGDYYKNKKIITTEYDETKEMRTVHCDDGATHTFNDHEPYSSGSKTSEVVERPNNQKVIKSRKYDNNGEVRTIHYTDGSTETVVHEHEVLCSYDDEEIPQNKCCNIS